MEPRIHRACRVMGKPTKKPEKTVKGRTLEAVEKSAVTHMADVSGKMSETVTWVTLTGNVSGILVRGEKNLVCGLQGQKERFGTSMRGKTTRETGVTN